MMNSLTLYDRLGGEDAIMAMVGEFYDRIVADPVLAPYFRGLDMDRQIDKQVAFMTMAFGGPHRYTGRDLRSAHAHLAGLTDVHFDALLGHLRATLGTLSVPRPMIEEIMGSVRGWRPDVLGR